MSQHTPEKWSVRHTRTQIDGRIEDTYSVGDSGMFTEKEEVERAVADHNATLDMSDPAKEIQSMRAALKEIASFGCDASHDYSHCGDVPDWNKEDWCIPCTCTAALGQTKGKP